MAWNEHDNKRPSSIFGVPEVELLAIRDAPSDQKARIPARRTLYGQSATPQYRSGHHCRFRCSTKRFPYDLVF